MDRGSDGPEARSAPETTASPTLDLRAASDLTLMVGVARRRQDALGETYRRYAGAVLGLARRVLVDRGLAEDIVQEIFLRLWREPARFDPERGSLRGFLLTQAHGRSVDLVRSESARRVREGRSGEREVDLRCGADEEIIDSESARHVRQAMNGLPEGERVAVELAYFGGYNYREVAIRLRTPEGTVKSRIRRGLGRLRSTLVDDGIAIR